ncbi:MAG: hypothetical protein EOO13_10005 [Chitinophagaceae bacterium]|nr:MAG: hypothetical protein EOO13_10005 [Chitinophagaceae bacterium]
MCNCGNKREGLAFEDSFSLSTENNHVTTGNKMWPDVNFEYTGKSALSVKGTISGKTYRFSKPGDVQLIDYRDVSAMRGVPVLKKLS